VHPEIAELQPKLKEILYDCAVEIRATKAALYLYEQRESRFELVTEYGFKGGLRQVTNRNDPVIDRCGRTRSAFFINGLVAEPLFSEMLYDASTDRMLVAPIYLRGQMVGFIDMRDKPAKQPFENSDLPVAAMIAERFVELFSTRNVFGHRFISVAPVGEQEFAPAGAAAGAPPSGAAAKKASTTTPAPFEAPALAGITPAGSREVKSTSRIVPRMSQLVQQAETAAKVLKSPSSDEITETEVHMVRNLLPVIVAIPGSVATVFSAMYGGGIQEIRSVSTMSDEAMRALDEHIDRWLDNRGEKTTFAKRNITGRGEPALTAEDIQHVYSSPVEAGSLRRVYLTVVFREEPDRAGQELMKTLHRQIESALELSVERRSRDHTRRRIAERLLEPDFIKYPELRRHTEAVVKRVDAFARFLGLNSTDVENARLLSIVHDVGMRVLDYERLYRKRDLSHEELELLKSHSVVGAAIVEPHLGREIALMVLMHHERWGGGGYPSGNVVKEEIPLLSRVLQICDAYESMVAMDTYHLPLPYDQAMEELSRGAGTDYDPELVEKFAELMRREP
jgi:hypothetical protein